MVEEKDAGVDYGLKIGQSNAETVMLRLRSA
jgi:hypothetical protein